MPTETARALGLHLGGQLRLTNLVASGEQPLTVELVGEYVPRDPSSAVWADAPLALVAQSRGDYTTFGAFLTAPDALDDAEAVTDGSGTVWRVVPDLSRLAPGDIGPLRTRLQQSLATTATDVGADLDSMASSRELAGKLRNARVESGLPDLLNRPIVLMQQIRAALLTPVVLLLLLAVASLVGAATLLAGLREQETRLLRLRGASSAQLVRAGLVDAIALAGLGVLVAAGSAPALVRALAVVTGLPPDRRAAGLGAEWRSGSLWVALALMAALVVVVLSVAAVGRSGEVAPPWRTGTAARLLARSGVDVLLVGLGVVAVLQLRRYPPTAAALDPLTTAAPSFLIAGLAVLAIRALPLLALAVARRTDRGRGLDATWSSWQLSRRLPAQTGTVLLVLLAQAMGTLALAHAATMTRAMSDQADFQAGSAVRLTMGGNARSNDRESAIVAAAGDRAKVMAVHREEIDLGPLHDVTLLGVDSAAAGVALVRPDLVPGGAWTTAAEGLARSRDLGAGLALSAGETSPRQITLTAAVVATGPAAVQDAGPPAANAAMRAELWLRDGLGLVHAMPLGELSTKPRAISLNLPAGDDALVGPIALVGISAPTTLEQRRDISAGLLRLRPSVTSVAVDGRPLPDLKALTDMASADRITVATAPASASAVPALVTSTVAEATGSTVGSTLDLTLPGRRVQIVVRGLLTQFPTARTPDRAIVVDLPTLAATPDADAPRQRPTAVLAPEEWWLDARAPADTANVLRPGLPFGASIETRERIGQDRTHGTVNSGMRAALSLLAAASLVLAVVGFAAGTAAQGVLRRHENAVLVTLGVAPSRIRRNLTLERMSLVVLLVLAGAVVGAATAALVVTRLVSGDGVAAVPAVLVVMPWGQIIGFALALTVLLTVIGFLVVRSGSRGLAGEMRRGAP
jgi:hypothetical protein